MNRIAEYIKLFGKLPKVNFAENTDDSLQMLLKMPPDKALEWLNKRGKNIIPTKTYKDMEKEAHNTAFTVANIMKADVLQEVHNYVQRAIEEGWSYNTFKKKVVNGDLIDRMKKAGWTGDESSRLKVIYDTNLRMASAKGRYQKLMNISDKKPYWIYHQVHRKTKRKDHEKFDGKKFRFDDPIWQTIYPPSGHGCSCWIEATDDPTGVENGNDYKDMLDKSEDFPISPLKVWEPDTTKYTQSLRAAVDEILKSAQNNVAAKPKANQMSNEYNLLFENPVYTVIEPTEQYTFDVKDRLFEPHITWNDIAKMTGAMTGSKFTFSTEHNRLKVNIEHPNFTGPESGYVRVFYKNHNDETCVHNDLFKPIKQNDFPKGIGAMALWNQVQALEKYNMNTIDTYAFGIYLRIEQWAGYYVWPELGFNSPIPQEFKKLVSYNIIPRNEEEEKKLDEVLNAKDLQELMSTEHGRFSWLKYGSSINVEFKINQDKEYLINVLKRKGIMK